MGDIRSKSSWDILLRLDSQQGGSLHDRLRRALRAAITAGLIPAASALPPSRVLAADLGCSRWVVTEAYAQLVAEGYLESRVGSATRVRAGAAAAPPAPPAARSTPPVFDLAPGLPDLRAFPRRRWSEAVHQAGLQAAYGEFGYPDQAGHPRLRSTLAEYLTRSRGADLDPAQLTICAGISTGALRIARALRAAGHSHIAVEDPGWPRLRQVMAQAGLSTLPVPVDEGGLRVDILRRHPLARAVLLAPAHQFPTGSVLSQQRRQELIAWAEGADGLILEDDYDAEFRYDRPPVGTLQGAAPSRVALLGSLSKTLSPALRIGWFTTPPGWTAAVPAVNPLASPPPVLDQLAFAGFLEAGGYDRHLRASRRRYRRRRDALIAALAARLPTARVSGAAAGLHLLLHLADGDAAEVRAAAALRGVRVADLASYQVRPQGVERTLILGYGNLADTSVEEAVARLAEAIEACGAGPAARLG